MRLRATKGTEAVHHEPRPYSSRVWWRSVLTGGHHCCGVHAAANTAGRSVSRHYDCRQSLQWFIQSYIWSRLLLFYLVCQRRVAEFPSCIRTYHQCWRVRTLCTKILALSAVDGVGSGVGVGVDVLGAVVNSLGGIFAKQIYSTRSHVCSGAQNRICVNKGFGICD